MSKPMRTKAAAFFHILLLRDSPLMSKLLVYSGVIIVLPLLCVGLILYRESSQVLEREARHFSWQMIDQIKMSIEDYLRDFEIDTIKILNHPDTVQFIQAKTDLTSEPDYDMEILAANVLRNSAYSRSDVVNISLIVNDAQVISSSDRSDSRQVLSLTREHWYYDVPTTGKPTIRGRVIEWNGKRQPVISIMKRVVHPGTLRPYGMLIIDLNYKRLNDVVRQVRIGESGQGYVFIVSDEGKYIYHLNDNLIGTQVSDGIMEALDKDTSGSVVLHEGTKKLLTYSRIESLGWNVSTSINYSDLMSSTSYIGRTILLTSVIFVLLAFIPSIGFSASIVRPIKRLHRYMKRVEIGILNDQVSVESQDEVGKLTHGFNKMVLRLSELLDEIYVSKLRETELELQQKETELQMLQAQINPHFLYNSLENIRGMALENDMDDIATMSSSLAQLLRYNVKGKQDFVTVKQELEIGELYLRIQKLRFDDKLEYHIDLPPWAEQQLIAKFTLQPLIENSIVHAVEQQLITTHISVKAQLLDDKYFAVMVSDTGPGISNQQYRQLLDCLSDEKCISRQTGSIGLLNVHKRIRHFFGDDCGLFIMPVPQGFTIGVRLPLHFHNEQEMRE